MWGVTGGYFVFPQPFRATIDFFTPISAPQVTPVAAPSTAGRPPLRRRPLTLGGKILRGFSAAHYGTFGGWGVKALWVVLGLAPVVLFPTALLMWYCRVIAPAMRRWRRGPF
jgi:uncharacterized iron-regulated membrane protein